MRTETDGQRVAAVSAVKCGARIGTLLHALCMSLYFQQQRSGGRCATLTQDAPPMRFVAAAAAPVVQFRRPATARSVAAFKEDQPRRRPPAPAGQRQLPTHENTEKAGSEHAPGAGAWRASPDGPWPSPQPGAGYGGEHRPASQGGGDFGLGHASGRRHSRWLGKGENVHRRGFRRRACESRHRSGKPPGHLLPDPPFAAALRPGGGHQPRRIHLARRHGNAGVPQRVRPIPSGHRGLVRRQQPRHRRGKAIPHRHAPSANVGPTGLCRHCGVCHRPLHGLLEKVRAAVRLHPPRPRPGRGHRLPGHRPGY